MHFSGKERKSWTTLERRQALGRKSTLYPQGSRGTKPTHSMPSVFLYHARTCKKTAHVVRLRSTMLSISLGRLPAASQDGSGIDYMKCPG